MSNHPLHRVLIVEDDAMVRRLLSRHFQKTGANTIEAGDAEQALQMFRDPDNQFDVVVADVHLPGLSGLDLATEMRVHRPHQPIVFVTGDVDEVLARRALSGGKAGYLLKPFEFFELDAAVAQAVQSAADSVAAPPTSGSEDRWLADQRRLLQAASQKPVDVSTFVRPGYKRRWPIAFWTKMIATVVVLIGVALFMGYCITSDQNVEPQPTPPAAETERGRTIYVPYEPPSRSTRPSDQPQRR